MNHEAANTTVSDLQQEQMLKIITKGFYKELINYGVDEKNIVTISTYLLDCLLKEKTVSRNHEHYSALFSTKDIEDEWNTDHRLKIRDVSISPLMPERYSLVVEWLQNPVIKYSFIPLFPESESGLKQYLEHPDRKYFSIFVGDQPVGVIGADNIDNDSRKLEMKKFIGNTGLQGKGIGKLATFLFLYYSFCILNFNKICIHSRDTNIRNINLNRKFGFELEGMFFDDVYVGNERHDVVRMALLKSQWLQIFSASR